MRKSTNKIIEELQQHDPEQVRQSRRAEAELASLKARLNLEQRKRQQAEQELDESREREQLLLSVRDQYSSHVMKTTKRRGKKDPCTPILCATDWHVEAKVDSAVVNGLNAFNLDICERRIHRLWDRAAYVIECWRNVSTIEDAVLWIGGDMISGSIHPELEESNFLGPGEAIVWAQQRIADGIQDLLQRAGLERLHVVCSCGNHGRTTLKKRVSTGYMHSYEWLMFQSLAGYFRSDKRVTFQVPNGYHAYCEVQGWTVRLHHGDSIRYQGGVGGITVPVTKAIAQWNKSKRADYDIFGHWHSYQDAWNWTSCGCLVGYDAYALSIKADFQPPTQTAVFLDRARGKVLSVALHVEEKGGKA